MSLRLFVSSVAIHKINKRSRSFLILRLPCSLLRLPTLYGSGNFMRLRLLYHGHCFDGVASAATFTRFYKERIHPKAAVSYAGLLHRPGNLLFEDDMFDGDENAIVDFKYSSSEKLTWWFDHHQSAFL